MDNIEYKIQRYELYPPEESTSFVVGFKISDILNNNRSGYIEALIPLTEASGKTSNEICQLAYNKIRPEINTLVNDLISRRNNLIGYTFVPNA
jgi:hypothetical protein